MTGRLQVIYQPAGRAREYSPWALNLYVGCGHGCEYCYAPAAIHHLRESFVSSPAPRKDIIARVEHDAPLVAGKVDAPVLLSFTSDAYQPIEEQLGITRQAIEILKHSGMNVTILTKAGKLPMRDLDLLGDGDSVGVSLTCDNDTDSLKWEPGASLPSERINLLREAHRQGISTWASLEPVLYPEQSLHLIDMTCEFVDKYKVGVLNYHPHAKTIDWPVFAVDVVERLQSCGADYYIKRDLARYMATHLP